MKAQMTKATPMTKAIQKTHSLLTCLEKHEYGTPIESNHYQKDLINLELQGPNDNQATANYTQHITENSSSRKNVYQNTINKLPPPKEKLWRIHI